MRRAWTRLSAAGLIGLTAMTVSSTASASVAPASTDPASAAPAPVVDVEGLIEQVGSNVVPAVYGGMVALDDGKQIAVYLTQLTPANEAPFVAVAPSDMLVFRSTPRSLESLEAIQAVLETKWNALERDGIRLNEFVANVETGKEDIGVEGLTAAAREKLQGMFGADPLNIFNVTAEEANASELFVSRTNDTVPYNGGDAIIRQNFLTGGCTSGFGVMINGGKRLVTAGHCFEVDDNIVNMRCTSGCTGSGADMGRVTQIGTTESCCTQLGGAIYTGLDSEVFTGCDGSGQCGGSPLIFTGPIGDSQIATVAGTTTWGKGNQVCESGAYNGEHCQLTVQWVNGCHIFYSPGRVIEWHNCNITYATGPDVGEIGRAHV